MTDLGALINPENVLAPMRFAPSAPLNTGEAAVAAFADQRNRLNVTSQDFIMQPLYQDRDAQLEMVTGKKREQLWADIGYPTDRADEKRKLDEFIIKGRENDERYKEVLTTAELQQVAERRVIKAKEATEGKLYENGYAETVGGMAGSIAGYLSDPVQLIGNVIVGGTLTPAASAAHGILKAAGREALVNAGITAAEQPVVMGWNKKLAIDYGIDEAMANVLMGGVAGGALHLAGAGAKKLASKIDFSVSDVFGRIAENEKLPPSVRDAASYYERVAHVEENNPFPKDLETRSETHFNNIAKAEADIEAGKPIEIKDDWMNPETWGLGDIELPPMRSLELGELTGATYKNYTPLSPRELMATEGVVAELNLASGGGRVFTEAEVGGAPVVQGWSSNTPEWFQAHNRKVDEARKALEKEKKGIAKGTINRAKPITQVPPVLTREKVNRTMDKLKEGKPLGKEEAKVAQIIFNAGQEWRRENARQYLDYRAGRQADKLPTDEWMAREGNPSWEALPKFDDAVKTMQETAKVDIDAVIAADIARMETDFPDFEVHLEDGSTMRLADIIEEARMDESYLNEIRTCAI